ncbi:lipopolysaccharide assembly protein LapB [Rothia sp. HMSC067H10]|uniref:tetratricopeptide repeat protein n=1 Tax=Rothia sp. HMSC067H10 TaxID=1739260 RepID=UPI0008A5829D|nr:tetratricopeptide repeat protein [Rothia sp. HMSC067H10]OFR97926.1 hypothetical protein HMPREF2756_07800 [Rothia sp. HMSC067H10]
MTEPNKSLEQMTAQERLELGRSYYNEGKFDEAIALLQTIDPAEYSLTYAEAQYGLGLAYKANGDSNKAINTWLHIGPEHNLNIYARAQFNLGKTYYYDKDRENPIEDAIEVWSKIRPDSNGEVYAWAQIGLGFAYHIQDKLAEAIDAWSKVRLQNGLTVYARAQLCLGEVYSLDKETEEQSHEAYNHVCDFSYYKSERGFKILKCPVEVRKNLHTVADNTDEVLKYLQIIPAFESKVAHYTRPQIAFDLFEDKKNNNDKEPSNFRFSTIRGVNDPMEGLVLNGYWNQQGIRETIHTNDTATFISCFTFNHDNLNQFRLYGKENGREATGVSLVFNKGFFSNQADTLEFIAGPSTDLSSKSEQNKSNETGKTEGDNKKQLIGKSTLYRCIYLDPETGYWTLAQRDKSTFYREHNEDADAKGKWGKYYKSISTKEEDVETHLFNKGNNEEEDVETHLLNKGNNDNNSVSNENNKIKSISQILNSIFTDKNHPYNKCDKDEKQKILEAVRFILLPLQYLVKHIAFQEEQECRIMYITQFRDEKIHSNREEQKMYVEYEEHVLPQHIDKIWLSPGAAKDQDFFRILLDKEDNDDKVRISQNPFRNKG